MNSVAQLSEADLRWIFTMQLLQQKVFDAITADISRQQDQVWARHMVLTDQAQAQSAYDRVTSGEDFVTVATEVMTGTNTTVDLGWVGKGTLDQNAETDFQNWIDEQKTAQNAQIFDAWKTKVPTSPTIPPTQVP
jgi:hypothetical protein